MLVTVSFFKNINYSIFKVETNGVTVSGLLVPFIYLFIISKRLILGLQVTCSTCSQVLFGLRITHFFKKIIDLF
jgi:hypothetical protein